jgi:AraC-like DNA-binding protein
MSFAEYPIRSHAANLQHASGGAFRCFRPRRLADVVDAIWDWDVPDELAAKSLTIKLAPSTSLLLMAQYRPAAVRARHLNRELPVKWATQIHEGTLYLQPSGPLGVIIVCLKPEGASRIVGAFLREFGNGAVDLRTIFPSSSVSTCEELLASAQCSAERIALVEAALFRRLKPRLDLTAYQAASVLRSDPAISLQQLASELDLSERQLSRAFHRTFGLGLKQFARLSRIERIVARRNIGLSWAEIAYATNLTDQAHLVREFKSIVGETPTEFFGRDRDPDMRPMHGANFAVRRR